MAYIGLKKCVSPEVACFYLKTRLVNYTRVFFDLSQGQEGPMT